MQPPAQESSKNGLKPGIRLLVSAAERSGDIHAASLVREIRKRRPDVEFEGFGGELLSAAGCRIHRDLVSHASFGFGFLSHLGRYVQAIRAFDRLLEESSPAAVLLVDSPGLHFIFARLARWHGVPVVYYICPQIWAWAPWRRSKILKYTDLLLVILPFEEGMYQNPQVPVVWVGHPLADSLSLAASDAGEKLRSHLQIPPERRVITIFPGSRELEVKKLIPLFREIVDRMDLDPGKHCLLVQSFREAFRPAIEAAMSGCRVPYRVLDEDPRAMAMASDFVFAKSGTTTLEVAYFEKPMMVLYRASALGRLLFYLLSVTPYFALPNVLGAGFRDGRPIVHEQLCRGDEAEKLAPVARSLLEAGPVRDEAIESLRWLKGSAFRPGATSRAADALISFLERRGWTKPE